MSDPNKPQPYLTPAPHPFTHPAAPLFPTEQQQQRPGPSLAQLPGVSTAGDPSYPPISVSYEEPSAGDDLFSGDRPAKAGVKPVRRRRADDQGVNTVSWVGGAAAVAAVAMAFVPQVQFAALSVSAIAFTVAVWGYSLPGFTMRQSKVTACVALAGIITVGSLALMGGPPAALVPTAAGGHTVTFEIEGTGVAPHSAVTWATDGPSDASTESAKSVSLPWKHTITPAGKTTGQSYSLWFQQDEGKPLAADSDLTCAIYVDGVAANRSSVTADGVLACSFYGDLAAPENVDIKH